MEKLTQKDWIKAFKCCKVKSGNHCKKCPLHKFHDLFLCDAVSREIFDIIKLLKIENKLLRFQLKLYEWRNNQGYTMPDYDKSNIEEWLEQEVEE